MQVYFSDYFGISKSDIESYGAFNISLINDLPVFIDPFLLFTSEKEEYKKLHDEMIMYISFLKDMSQNGELKPGLIKSWFLFPEVKQNWLGYSKTGNSGSGLGHKFAKALNENLSNIFSSFGREQITKGSHLEKLCLVKSDVGRDNISDFTTNLIKGFLCEYTQEFALKFLDETQRKKLKISHSEFNYEYRKWLSKEYILPYIDNDFVLLTPKDILTKDDTWINKNDLIGDFESIENSISNQELRDQINEYLLRLIPEEPKKKDIDYAKMRTILKYPELIDYYIRFKEDNGEKAKDLSTYNVKETESIFIDKVESLIDELQKEEDFLKIGWNTYEETYNRILYLKHVIENNDGYKIFYHNNKPIKRESDLQLMFRLTWFATPSDVNSEVNNGRGPVDFKISRGFQDKTLVEFKLASNSKLKQNLAKQVDVYLKANQTKSAIKVIMYFDDSELIKVNKILKELNLDDSESIILIDSSDNKPSASNVKI